VKSILDIGLTLEALETLGVPVLAYGTDEFPAFFSRRSGHPAPMRVDTPQEVAAVMAVKWDLGISGGLAVVCPIPVDDELPAVVDRIIEQAWRTWTFAASTVGRNAFLLGRIVEIGASLTANIALVKNNAYLGAQVATAYAALADESSLGLSRTGNRHHLPRTAERVLLGRASAGASAARPFVGGSLGASAKSPRSRSPSLPTPWRRRSPGQASPTLPASAGSGGLGNREPRHASTLTGLSTALQTSRTSSAVRRPGA
jgi:hypothetical protein